MALLTSDASAGFLDKMFGKKVAAGESYDHTSSEIIIEDGNKDIGEIIYHPADYDPNDTSDIDGGVDKHEVPTIDSPFDEEY